MQEIRLNFKKLARQILIVFIAVEICLVLGDFLFAYLELIESGPVSRLFNITRENNIPSWWASSQYLLLGAICFLIFYFMRMSDPERKTARRFWMFFGWVFVYFSMDDASKFHERIGSFAQSIIQSSDALSGEAVKESFLSAFPSYYWILVFMPIFGLIGLLMLYFFWKELKTKELRLRLICALALMGTAVLLDFIEGIEGGHDEIKALLGSGSYTTRHFGKSIEEFFEMASATLFLNMFITHLGVLTDRIRIYWEKAED